MALSYDCNFFSSYIKNVFTVSIFTMKLFSSPILSNQRILKKILVICKINKNFNLKQGQLILLPKSTNKYNV